MDGYRFATIPIPIGLRCQHQPLHYEQMFCSIEACGRHIYSRDMCEMHYRLWLRRSAPEKLLREPGRKTCMVHSCKKKVDARGLCHGHYERLMRGSDLTDADPLVRRKQEPICSVDQCGRPTSATGLCKTHLTRLQKYGDVRADQPIKHRKGEGFLTHGYRSVPVPRELRHLTNGETPYPEHRLVMAMALGRPLAKDESVHHRNGIRTDNRIENLELWSRWQPSGGRVEDKIGWARQVLARYESTSSEDRSMDPSTPDRI